MTFERIRELWLTFDPFFASGTAKTLLLVALVGVLRLLFSRTLDRNPEIASLEARRRWKVTARNVAFVVLLSGIILIWAEELSSLMLSLVAIAAAIVIAFKEVINCLSGTLMRTTTRAFAIGDRIEIAGLRGDVIDYSLLSTTLMEVGPGQQTHQFTGRAIVVPNSLLLSNALINETFTDDYLLHVFTVAIPRASDWKLAERALLEAARAEAGAYLDAARSFLDEQANRRSIASFDAEPRVRLRLDDPAQIKLVVRMAVPARGKGRIEHAVLRRFLEATAQEAPSQRAVSASGAA